jgi:hypothetical protein
MSLLKGFTSLFDWMFPKTLNESLEGLDESLQHLYDKMNWGKYQAYPTAAAWNVAVDITFTNEPPPQTIYASKETLKQLMSQNYGDEMKLTDKDIDILQELLEDKLQDIANGPEGLERFIKPEVYINIMKKLDEMYR